MLKFLAVCAALFWPGLATAADQPIYARPPAWVKPHPIPAAPPQPGVAVQYLLSDNQANYDAAGDGFYVETAAKILQPQGLSAMGTVFSIWNPETDTVTIHRLAIIRNGQVIDLLAGGKTFTVLRRETNLELAMLDGSLTATFQPEGLQVGDVLDFAVTVVRHDPVMAGMSQGINKLAFPGVVTKVYFSALWPSAKPMRWLITEGFGQPVVTHPNGGGMLSYDLSDVVTPQPPTDAPARYNDLGMVELSQFKDWADVSSLMAPLYVKAAAIKPGSSLMAEADRIRASSSDPKVRADAALHLVQDKVRYLFLGMNLGGLTPADAEVTWTRRFGDCKGKTALLLALLHELGIEAQPALVSTGLGDGLDLRLPMLAYFDHVMVRATIGGKVYWLDGTRQGDRGVDDIDIPDFGWVLPLRSADAKLVRLSPPPALTPLFENRMLLDVRAGLGAKTPAHIERLFRGDAAIALHILLGSQSAADQVRYLKEYWRGENAWIDVDTVAADYDEKTGVERLTMDGKATIDWQDEGGGVKDFDVGDSSLGWNATYKRDPGPHQDAPFTMAYPMYKDWTVTVQLPAKGVGFHLIGGGDVDQTIAAVEFKRTSTISDGVVTIHASERSLAPEFASADADKTAAALAKLAEKDVDIRAGAAYEATLPVTNTAASSPQSASEFAASGYQKLSSQDYRGAIADLTHAIALDSTVYGYVYNRGVAHYELAEDNAAVGDFTAALKLKPDDILALMARGETYLHLHDDQRATADFDKAQGLSKASFALSGRVADAYERMGRHQAAAIVYDSMLPLAMTDQQRVGTLNNQCWARAELGRQLDQAKAACDAALALQPKAIGVLDSRGLVDLRLGRFDQALADYGAAVAGNLRFAHALYGRGLAERALGRKAAADADLSAAKAIDAKIEAAFAAYHLGL